MEVFDAHCDFLGKLEEDPTISFIHTSNKSAVSKPRLEKGNIALQFFSIFISKNGRYPTFADFLSMYDHGQREVFSRPDVKLVQFKDDLQFMDENRKLGALLSLEGVEALEGDLMNLRIAYWLGVRSIGVTWNHANWAADGIMVPRGAGLTLEGRKLVAECMRLGMMIDVSHMSERGFWEIVELTYKPFHASHSNVKAICPHPRNLDNNQIDVMIKRNGIIGLTFVPYFVRESDPQMNDLLHHIDHICARGGQHHIGFGSDFDGISEWIPNLEHPGHYSELADLLLKHYSEDTVRNILAGNWRRYLFNNLPDQHASFESKD